LPYFFGFLSPARAENVVLKEHLKKMEVRVKALTVENESLKAEVEMYREDAAGQVKSLSLGQAQLSSSSSEMNDIGEDFFKSGNGIYPSSCEVTLENLHAMSNVLCCSLSPDDTVLATGGADNHLSICQWGAALTDPTLVKPIHVSCSAPVICVDFAKTPRVPFLAAGCMDGSVHLVHYSTPYSGLQAKAVGCNIKHGKYIKNLAWSPTDSILATASADGSVQVHKITSAGIDGGDIKVEKIQSLQLPGPVESMCFAKDHLCCYARGTPYLSYFDLGKDFAQTKINLNQGTVGTGAFDEHVSFCVMDMAHNGKYLALATDTSRNVVLDWATGKQIRNLYGHTNDGYSNPKLAWSQNGEYLLGNTQDAPSICVWDVASSSIIKRLEGHTNPIRDMYSSSLTDTLVTTAYDKKTSIWLATA
jgi:WD40 repeat protein